MRLGIVCRSPHPLTLRELFDAGCQGGSIGVDRICLITQLLLGVSQLLELCGIVAGVCLCQHSLERWIAPFRVKPAVLWHTSPRAWAVCGPIYAGRVHHAYRFQLRDDRLTTGKCLCSLSLTPP